MRLSAFTVVRNAEKYYFPIKACIESVLPLVDEFVVALGDSAGADATESIVRSIPSAKVRILQRSWDERLFKDAAVLREETTFALKHCSGDWCLYLQADEVVHEDDLPIIKDYCSRYLDDPRVEGFLFQYLHFWGDYGHYALSHAMYPREIRVVRGGIGVESYLDAQSFRVRGTRKLQVVETPARIFHYGWVRPPEIMNSKRKEQFDIHRGRGGAPDIPQHFEYGPLGRLKDFRGTHPLVMKEWIRRLHWQSMLDYGKAFRLKGRDKILHERAKHRFLTFLEQAFLGGRQLFGWHNWEKIKT